ncbi:hypothetical protein E0H73_08350 [Kribbella pittospori]|uniref:Uncharacterized protein n=1 Tax=Kribbella pittospori TaxID=722689 RepID=A0A4R0KXG3_9ACTN|nr:hypothetical protein [Kribbella pittospori]TCC64404.1 hypothetical protein E0H73_08350 [Kribbella pittospori]
MTEQRNIASAGNTVVPAILALEAAGYRVSQLDGDLMEATSPEGRYVAEDPLMLLGLIKLVELRTWSWRASDPEIDSVLARFGWAG